MKKLLGLFAFLLLLYAVNMLFGENAFSKLNHINLAKRVGMYGIITLGVGVLIISGGIDLSIGSVVGFSGTIMATLLLKTGIYPAVCVLIVVAIGILIGMIHGLLITKLKLQPFIVTLCGLFIYRGAARWLAGDKVLGLETKFETLKKVLYTNREVLDLPMSLVIFVVLALFIGIFLHFSVFGRYLFAIGSNEPAARYAGIATDRYRILSYALCAGLAAFYGVMHLMEQNSVQPSSTGTSLELYAIAGAVLGGCSLRGGDGHVGGMVIGTAILVLLPNIIRMVKFGNFKFESHMELLVLGTALMIGALLDELMRRRVEKRKLRQSAATRH